MRNLYQIAICYLVQFLGSVMFVKENVLLVQFVSAIRIGYSPKSFSVIPISWMFFLLLLLFAITPELVENSEFFYYNYCCTKVTRRNDNEIENKKKDAFHKQVRDLVVAISQLNDD